MLRPIFLAILIIFQLFLSPIFAASKAEKIKVTGIYSSFEFNKEGGDILGDEILIGFSREGYFVVFQTSEGEPALPVVVPATINDQQITFTLPAPMNERGQFIGAVSPEGLVGKFQSSQQVLHLKRKQSYWQ